MGIGQRVGSVEPGRAGRKPERAAEQPADRARGKSSGGLKQQAGSVDLGMGAPKGAVITGE